MSKGIEWWTFVLFVILLAICIIAVFSLLKQKFNFINATEATVLEQAIACSYWRCAEGCGSPLVHDTETFKCKSDFCNPQWTDTGKPDGKICFDNAKKHPVNVILPTSTELGQVITQDLLVPLLNKNGEKNEFFISPSGAKCQDLGGGNIIYIDNNENVVLQTQGKDFLSCAPEYQTLKSAGGPDQCLNQILVSTGTYYIWTAHNRFGIALNTIVCSEEPETAVKTIGCGDAGGVCRSNTCYGNEQQISASCVQHGGEANQVCCKTQTSTTTTTSS